MRDILINHNPTVKIILGKQRKQLAILNTVPLHILHRINFMLVRKILFETYINIFIKQYFHAVISAKSFSAANSITASACCLVTEGKPLRKSSMDPSSR